MTTSDLVARLAALDTCAVLSDALDRLGLRGVALGIRPLTVTERIAGRVVTVQLGPTQGAAPAARHLGTAAIEAATPGDVIVVDHQGREDAAGWGGILSTAAKVKGILGVIVDGACRDVDESRALGFPVYARTAVPLTARGRAVEESFNQPVTIAGVPVRPGDLVLADGSGVVFVPAERAEEVIATAEAIAAREAEMTRAVLAGQPVSQVMDRVYETMVSRSEGR
jgi:4-hydroxy-4-methyl-2-oxoglutarate aldolase